MYRAATASKMRNGCTLLQGGGGGGLDDYEPAHP